MEETSLTHGVFRKASRADCTKQQNVQNEKEKNQRYARLSLQRIHHYGLHNSVVDTLNRRIAVAELAMLSLVEGS